MSAWFTAQRLAMLVAALLGLGLVVLLLLPAQLPSPRSVQAQSSVWSLPVPVTVESDTALSTITQRRLWGAPSGALMTPSSAAADEPALTPIDWRIAGVFSEGGRLALLIVLDGKPLPQTLRVGDSLPGGARILAVHSDRVILSLHGQRVALSTYPQ